MSGGKISLSIGKSKNPPPANGVKRSHAALRDHDVEDDDVEGKAQTVSHFDRSAGGAVDEKNVKEVKGPMVIASQANRDWKEASARNKRLKYAQVADAARAKHVDAEVDVEAMERDKPSFGLNIAKRKDAREEGEEGDAATNGHTSPAKGDQRDDDNNDTSEPQLSDEASPPTAKTADEEALSALLGTNPTKTSTLILPALTEDQAFDRDYHSAPDMATLADYDRVPVEEFGAAMLRGMGWKDGEGIGSSRGKAAEQTKIPKRRPALLGIGAREEAAVAEEMGAWGKGGRGRKEVKVYNPVLLRDKRTGELMTEEEVEARKEKEERERLEFEFEEKEKERKRRDRDRDDGRKGGEKESRHERRDDGEKDRRRRDDSDEEYYRRKKEKERRRRERDGDDYDRERERDRSRRHDSDRERQHDSGRDRHRDRHRERRH